MYLFDNRTGPHRTGPSLMVMISTTAMGSCGRRLDWTGAWSWASRHGRQAPWQGVNPLKLVVGFCRDTPRLLNPGGLLSRDWGGQGGKCGHFHWFTCLVPGLVFPSRRSRSPIGGRRWRTRQFLPSSPNPACPTTTGGLLVPPVARQGTQWPMIVTNKLIITF
jgi:hypothetical protein